MNKELENYTKSFVNNDEKSKEYFSSYLKEKMRSVLNIKMNEDVDMGPIKLSGDDVYVNDKLVGHLTNDLNDFDKGIVFTPIEGQPQEFENIRQIYRFLLQNYANGKVLK